MNTTNDIPYVIQLRFVKFSLFLLFAIPSTFCAIYIIYCFIRFPLIRKRFYYETIIFLSLIVLIKIFFNISISLSYYARGYIQPRTKSFCQFWQYIDSTLAGWIIWCLAVFTVERYLLVFYPNCLRFRRQRILFHYLPIILSHLYLVLFYIFGVFIVLCDATEKFDRHLCGTTCLDLKTGISQFNWCFNVLLPVFIIIFGSIVLLIRVIWTRRKMQRNLRNWSKNWKMIVQLLGIAIVYAIVWLPLSVISLIDTFTTTSDFDIFAENYMYYLTYITDMCVPIVGFLSSPEINRHLYRRTNLNVVNVASVTTGPY